LTIATVTSAPSETVQPIALSVLIRTLNEADRIAETIRSALLLGGEIVVIDAGSQDDTVAIATALGAKVIGNPWPGFGPQRRFGEEQCSNDFIFSLDADELLTPQIVAEIRGLFIPGPPPPLMIVRKAMIFPHHRKPPPFGFCHEQVLIYDRRIARTGMNPNWDRLEISTEVKPHRVLSPLWHYSLRDWHHAVAKLNYVAKLAAETQKPRPRGRLLLRAVVEFPATFLKFYFLRRYFLGGIDGFNMAVVTAFGRWLRIVTMLERKDHEPR
jgi:glycosyltransferase involved in cell wall biosynthesis